MTPLAWLVELYDPAARYLRRHGGRLRSRPRRRATDPGAAAFGSAVVFGPGVPGGARPATPEEMSDLSGRAGRHRDRHRAAVEAARRRWGDRALACARELLEHGSTVLPVDNATVRGRLVRLWRGDSVLELRASRDSGTTGSSTTTSSLTRLSRRHQDPQVIAEYLVHVIAQVDDGQRR
ncbi:hypothetical protein [Planosporangium mesophilum]|uniref:Uncharacterized protein n=1 Tax=Planosporangium mesophilum TaxID=689768 RepID=A0A8J3X2R8_9ACTN|nr:hypothetical protein [Planosporangium mesophilum]NJC86646.1 hypothetical protein [Planosporangium mesophilum]GII25792.1 hypothetical protein Pme01_53890 [Planosporangium mesophilum]